jgi:hypothetical protein
MEILFKVATNSLSQDDQFLICSIKLFLIIVYFKQQVTKRSNLLPVEFAASVVDTGSKFATGINNTSGQRKSPERCGRW